MIRTEMVTHEGYDVPREVFATFFPIVRDTLRDILGAEWTPEFETAWAELLVELDRYIDHRPRTDKENPYYKQLRERFENGQPAQG
jgi:hypothetical protein